MRVGRIPSQVLTSGADGSSGEQGPSGDRKADGNLGDTLGQRAASCGSSLHRLECGGSIDGGPSRDRAEGRGGHGGNSTSVQM